jgi:hypothetical protein
VAATLEALKMVAAHVTLSLVNVIVRNSSATRSVTYVNMDTMDFTPTILMVVNIKLLVLRTLIMREILLLKLFCYLQIE